MNLLPTIGLLCLFLLVGSFAIALVFRRTKRYVFNAESKYKTRSAELEIERRKQDRYFEVGLHTHDTPTAVEAKRMVDYSEESIRQSINIDPRKDPRNQFGPSPSELHEWTAGQYNAKATVIEGSGEVHIAFVPPSELKPFPVLVDKWIKVLCNKEGLHAENIVLHVTNANSRPSGKIRVKEIVHHKNFRELGLSEIKGLVFVEIKIDGYKPRVQAKQAELSLNWILDREQAKETVSHVSEVIGSFDEYLGSRYRKSMYKENPSGDTASIQERLKDVSDADQANFDHFVAQAGVPFRLTYSIFPGGRLATRGAFVHPA